MDWFRTLSSNFGCYRPLSNVTVRCRMHPSSEASAPFQTLPCDFGRYRPFSPSFVQFRTLSSYFGRNRPNSDPAVLFLKAVVLFRTLSFNSERLLYRFDTRKKKKKKIRQTLLRIVFTLPVSPKF